MKQLKHNTLLSGLTYSGLFIACSMARKGGSRYAYIVGSEEQKQQTINMVYDIMKGAWPIGLRILVTYIEPDYEIF